jgi:hypothetical protein
MSEEHGRDGAAEFLRGVGERIEKIRQDVPRLVEMGGRMAEHLLAGGEIFVPPVARWWVSEFSARAGGLMGITWGDHAGPFEPGSKHDVAYVALPAKWTDPAREQWQKLIASPASIFAIGEPSQVAEKDRVEAFTGLSSGWDHIDGVRQFAQLVRGWLAAGEMIAACTRAGKMPIIWMSVWLEGALVRNAAFYKHDNLREPWKVPLFHDRMYVPPLAERYVADAFLAELSRIHAVLVAQNEKLARAGGWIAEAKKKERRVSMVAVGHSYPEILESDPCQWPVNWSKPVSHVRRAHPADLCAGDVAVHLGYSPVDSRDVRELLDRGVRFVYSSPYGRPAALADHENLIWLDLPWRPGDATVDVPGYSVRILPMSSSAHTMAYFALMAQSRG